MQQYQQLIKIIGNELKGMGFVKKGKDFYILKENNWGVINIQPGKWNSQKEKSFTLNLGICSNLIRKTIEEIGADVVPDIDRCHWKMRIGFLMPEKKDHWWEISESTSIDQLGQEITTILETNAIPEIEKNISDTGLMDQMLNGNSQGITELQRYIYLTTFLKLFDDGRLALMITELEKIAKGKSWELAAKEHIKELANYGK